MVSFNLPRILRQETFSDSRFLQEQKRSIQALFESFGQRFESLEDFKQHMMALKKHEFVIFDTSKDGMEAYSYLKAPGHVPNFHINVK
jgi:hypothetical protein